MKLVLKIILNLQEDMSINNCRIIPNIILRVTKNNDLLICIRIY